jgi:hypothetical protein
LRRALKRAFLFVRRHGLLQLVGLFADGANQLF